jgi:hypothetical protein
MAEYDALKLEIEEINLEVPKTFHEHKSSDSLRIRVPVYDHNT